MQHNRVVTVRGHPFITSTRRGEWGTHVDGEGVKPHVAPRPQRKLKLESTDVILSSSHSKKLASFLPEFRLSRNKSGNFLAI